jgi:hypothetical protein
VPDGQEIRLPPVVTAPKVAREFVREALASENLDGVGDATELLTTELVANVVEHVGSAMAVRVYKTADLLRVEVDDTSTAAPVVRERDEPTPSGNGMLLVDSLATRWGIETRAEGKTVWFELETSTAPEEVDGGSGA